MLRQPSDIFSARFATVRQTDSRDFPEGCAARQAEANKFSALETKFKALEEEHNDLLVMLADGGGGEGESTPLCLPDRTCASA
jgi:hypothetical protein